MSYEDEHIAALQGIYNVLRSIRVQMQKDAVAKKLYDAQLLATLRGLKPKEPTQ